MIVADSLSALRQLTSRFQSMTDQEWAEFSLVWEPISAKRKEQLTQQGSIETYVYFVVDGVQRVYYEDASHEATLVFTYAPSFGGVLDSFMMQQPSRYNYETLSPSQFLRTSYQKLSVLMEKHRAVEMMIRKGITFSMSGLMERMVELECFSAEERFRTLLKRSPHILQLVPHKYLASYIGIDATNFSKLINSVKI